VINGLMQVPIENRPKLGIVPLGSGNDFAHNLGLPMDAGQALRKAMNGQSRFYDLGRMQDEHGRIEYWNNTMGIGFDTTVLLRTRKMRYFTGFLGYLVAVIQTILLDHEPIQIELKIDEEQKELSKFDASRINSLFYIMYAICFLSNPANHYRYKRYFNRRAV
jgi:diacylglycerol kinase family enzyme